MKYPLSMSTMVRIFKRKFVLDNELKKLNYQILKLSKRAKKLEDQLYSVEFIEEVYRGVPIGDFCTCFGSKYIMVKPWLTCSKPPVWRFSVIDRFNCVLIHERTLFLDFPKADKEKAEIFAKDLIVALVGKKSTKEAKELAEEIKASR